MDPTCTVVLLSGIFQFIYIYHMAPSAIQRGSVRGKTTARYSAQRLRAFAACSVVEIAVLLAAEFGVAEAEPNPANVATHSTVRASSAVVFPVTIRRVLIQGLLAPPVPIPTLEMAIDEGSNRQRQRGATGCHARVNQSTIDALRVV